MNYELMFIFLFFGSFNMVLALYNIFSKPLAWLDAHLFHIGYNPQRHQSIPGDTHYGLVYFLTTILLCLLIVIIWSLAGKRKPNYNKLNYWFRVYMRYMVALIMLGYGIDKLIPVQMAFPGVTDLLRPVGENNLFTVLWNFMGVSPGYEIFTGLCEVLAGILLLIPRTQVFGALVMSLVLSNVVALNIFYNVSVKLYSSLLFICTLYLLIPYVNTLIQFFYYHRSVSLTEKKYWYSGGWKKYFLIIIAIVIPAVCILGDIIHTKKAYNQQMLTRKNEKLYDVTSFIAKDSAQNILADSLRWNKLAFAYSIYAVVYFSRGTAAFYQFKKDSIKHTYTFQNNPDTAKWDVLTYTHPSKNEMEFTGTWKGNDVHIRMKEVSFDSMNLNKEKVIFFQD